MCPYKVNTFIGGLNGSICPIFGIKHKESFVDQLDLLLLITYWAISGDRIETITKPIHQSIARKLLKVLFRSA